MLAARQARCSEYSGVQAAQCAAIGSMWWPQPGEPAKPAASRSRQCDQPPSRPAAVGAAVGTAWRKGKGFCIPCRLFCPRAASPSCKSPPADKGERPSRELGRYLGRWNSQVAKHLPASTTNGSASGSSSNSQLWSVPAPPPPPAAPPSTTKF